MYKAVKSIRFVEMVKVSLVLFMHKLKEGLFPAPIRNLLLQHPERPNT